MKMTDLRAKARAIFGNAIAEPMPNQPNGAKALQQRANARPIPTYKVGGVVKKANGGGMPSNLSPADREAYMRKMRAEQAARGQRNTPEADDVLITTRRGQQIMDAQKRREMEMERKRREKQAAADKLLGIRMKNGGKMPDLTGDGKVTRADVLKGRGVKGFAEGSKVQTSSDTARKLATEMGGMKKGGKAKDGLAVMIAIGKVKKPVKEKATGEMYASKAAMKKHEAKESPAMQRAERKMNGGAAGMRDKDMEAAKVTSAMKMAVGGAGKIRKGQAPIKKAQGGAAKVRKGMMSESGKMLQPIKPKSGLGDTY